MPGSSVRHTLPKEEIISGTTAITALMKGGKWNSSGDLRYCVLHRNVDECNRIMVSVPKRNFKRAVKRNLLKRRLREAYRLQKELLTCRGTDILLVYSSKIVAEFDDIRNQIAKILTEISRKAGETEKIDA